MKRFGSMPALAAGIATIVLCDRAGGAQQRNGRGRTGAAQATVDGAYSLSFTPANSEPLTGRIEIRSRDGRTTAVFTSPRLSAPLVADSLRIVEGHVFASIFHGGYTFEFDVRGDTISEAKYTKTVEGKIESAAADIRRATP